ncbi:MAG: Spy0128 family protein [Eggerthellaceae bacterium]|jgi:pilin isopeptide linkage protein/LPXTG-motif cell wall-anchored protein
MNALSKPLFRILLSFVLVAGLMPVTPTALAESGGAASSSTVAAQSAESADSADSASTPDEGSSSDKESNSSQATDEDGSSSLTSKQTTGKSSAANRKARPATPLRAGGNSSDANVSIKWTQGSDATISDDGTDISLGAPQEINDGVAAKGEIEFSCSQGTVYKAGSIKITLPLYLYKDRYGGNAGKMLELGIPEAPETSSNSSFNYMVDEETGIVTITNYEDINSTLHFTCDFQYAATGDRDLNSDENIYAIKSNTKFELPWTSSVQAEGSSAVTDEGTLTATYNSDVNADEAHKSKKDRYVKWQSSWGEQPSNISDDSYVYYVFEVQGDKTINGQPYKYQFVDQPGNGGIAVAWQGEDSYQYDENGNDIYSSWHSFANNDGTTDWSALTAYPDFIGNYAYYSKAMIVVAYPKTAEANGAEMTNTVTYRVQGADQQTPTEQSTTLTFKNDTVAFSYAGDLFAVKKSRMKDKEDSVQGALRQLNEGKDTTTPILFRCSTPSRYENGNTFYLKGYSLTQENGEYGKKCWTGELIDDQLYLEGELLQPGDYEISSLDAYAWHQKLIIDPDRDSYTYKNVFYYDEGGTDENNIAAVYYRTSTTGDWILAKTASDGNNLQNIDLSGKGAIQVKCVAKTNDYGMYLSMTPSIKLKPTAHVKQIIEGKTSVQLMNIDSLRVLDSGNHVVNQTSSSSISGSMTDKVKDHDQQGGYGLDADKYLQHDSATYNLTDGNASETLTKDASLKGTDSASRTSTIHYSLKQQLQWGYGGYISPETYQELMGGLQHTATFYDLLPLGMSYKEGSVKARLNGIIWTSETSSSSDYQYLSDIQVTQVPNWRNSGRTMVKFTVNVPETQTVNRSVTLSFDGIYPYDSGDDYGITPVNDAAVSTDLNLNSCYADSPTSPRGEQTSVSNDTWSSYLTDLDGDGVTGTDNALSTAYASASATASHLGSAETGFTKAVKAAEDASYGTEAETYADGIYTYRLRYRPDDNSAAKGLVFYDTIENAYGSNEHWKGTLQSVDVAYMRSQGVDAKVYYSTAAGCDPRNNEGDRDLSDASKWSTAAPSDMSKVTAVAIDLTKNTDGNDFVLQAGRTASAILYMQAPENVMPYIFPTKTYAYNDSAVNAQIQQAGSSSFSSARVLNTQPTKVKLRVEKRNLTLSKAVTGTQENKDHEYVYDLTFSQMEPNTTYTFYKGTSASGTASDYSFTTDNNGAATTQVKLKDSEQLTVAIPLKARYSVSEQGTDEMCPSYTIASGGETLAQGSETDTGAALSTGEQTLSGDTAVAYTNENKATVDLEVKKVWDDTMFGGDRAQSVKVRLLKNGSAVEGSERVLFEGNEWSDTYEDLAKYDEDYNEITYSVEETTDLGAGWTKKVDGPSGTVKYWTVTNTYTPTPTTAAIPVEKVLAKGDDSYTAPDIAGEFEFTIKDDPSDQVDSPLPADKTVKCGASGATVSFGAITYTKPGTYTYKVTESGSLPGVANDAEASTGKAVTVTVKDNAQGALYVDSVSSTEASPLTFTNTYTPDPAEAAIPVRKSVSHDAGLAPADVAGKFEFAIADDASDGVDSPLPDDNTVECGKDGETVSFGKIEFTKPGTYRYLVTESGSAGGITNDSEAESGKSVTVKVSDDGTGKLKVDSVSSTEASPLTFTNTYTPDPAEAAIPVRKSVSHDAGLAPADVAGKFEFAIADDASDGVDSPLPDDNTVECGKDGETVSFGKIEFTKPGTYRYLVTESGSAGGITNDSEAESGKSVTVKVSDDGTGKLKVDSVSSTAASPLTFTNTYTVQPTTAAIPVEKVLAKGDDSYTAPDVTGKFTFKLAAQDGAPMPASGGETVECAASGTAVSFGSITYTKPGTYKYLVTESGTLPGVANDEDASAGKAVTVTVKDNGDGTMTATVNGADATADKASEDTTFTNTYTPSPVSVAVPVKKTVAHDAGLTPADIAGKFTFTIADDPSDNVDSPLPADTTVKCGKDGATVSFSKIKYTKPGTYKYLVTESGEAGGISNDAAAASGKSVTVTVTDDGSGQLAASTSGADATEDEASDDTTFTNTYTVDPATAAIPVTKTLSYADGLSPADVAGKFTFEIKDDPSDNVDSPLPADTTIKCGKAGDTVKFAEIEFAKPGTYRYLVTESGSAGGITNDPDAAAGKLVTVTVADDGDGTMTATVSGADATADQTSEDTTFTNTYTVQPTSATIPVKKVLKKGDSSFTAPDIAGKFTFTIADDSGDQVDSPLPGNKTVKCGGDGDAVDFDAIEYSMPGTYRYLVTESGNLNGVENDSAGTSGKAVEVVVRDGGDGALYVDRVSSTDERPLTFTNTYIPDAATATIPVHKELAYDEDSEPGDITGKFSFTLKAEDGAPMPAKGGEQVANTGNGKDHDGGIASFGTITYTEPGTYTYTITESGTAENVVNDKDAAKGKTVTVTVSDDGSGSLEAAISGADTTAALASEGTTFTNEYRASDSGEMTMTRMDMPKTGDGAGMLALALGVLAALGAVALVLAVRRRNRG